MKILCSDCRKEFEIEKIVEREDVYCDICKPVFKMWLKILRETKGACGNYQKWKNSHTFQ